ncbi:MAG: PilZ domain-containing protein [Desulfobacter sp.]|nr:MAG: PilZ domain-containing protein [Desulfobacter sp.]
MKRNRRIQPRETMKIPILYTREYENIYHQARTCDISVGGLSFEADQKFLNGDCFLIKPMAGVPGFEPAHRETPWAAQVQWCSKNRENDGYKVGIRRMETTDLPKEKKQVLPELQCELCGTRTIADAVDIQYGSTLCPDCFTECYQCAGEKLKDTISRFMSGNVI